MQDITLKQLEIFNAVVVAGSITKASRRIGLSQPSISQQLAKLEEKLGSQLVVRKRGGAVALSPAGEYWYSASTDMIARLRIVFSEHDERFVSKSLTLRLGVTPTLRGRFVSEAARIASLQSAFVKFEARNAATGSELVEMLRLHQLNCAIVTDDEIIDDRHAFAITELFDDPFMLVVPADVTDNELYAAFGGEIAGNTHPSLAHFVDVDAQVTLRHYATEWYRHRLPIAEPTFSANTYPLAFDMVTAGIATAICPVSMLPSQSTNMRESVRLVSIDSITRKVVLAMPKHLMSLRSYAETYHGIAEFCRTEYSREMIAPWVNLGMTK